MNILPFSFPIPESISVISATTTSANAQFLRSGSQIMFINATSQGCYVNVETDNSVAAGPDTLFIPGNTMRVFTVDASAGLLWWAAETPAGTTTMQAIVGDGA